MTQNFTPPPNDGQRGSGRANPIEFLPFLAFLGFIYIGLTMGHPDRPIWEQPAIANDGEKPLQPQCIKDPNDADGVYEWVDCPQQQLQDTPKFFNTLTQRWE